ncbi:hypothetical protein AURDEDRAFT_173361 [Auricularia subglabra TFB-10046 SS5]|nr:hypothetical protein AURDEDRAFT_173361 [Auricularia subglabra TFB-10046 SS5]
MSSVPTRGPLPLRPVYLRQGFDNYCAKLPQGYKEWPHYRYLEHIQSSPVASRYAKRLRNAPKPVRLPVLQPMPRTPPPLPLPAPDAPSAGRFHSPRAFLDDLDSDDYFPLLARSSSVDSGRGGSSTSPLRTDSPMQPEHPLSIGPEPHASALASEDVPGQNPDPDSDDDVVMLEAPEDPSGPDHMPMHSAARGETPFMRYAYLSAAINRTFRGQTYRQAEDGLRDMLGYAEMTGHLSTDPAPATTLVSAMRRLKLDPDECIIRYASCPMCWLMFSPDEVARLASPNCPGHGCHGVIYSEARNARNKLLRTLSKIVPYVSIIQSLRRMMLRPEFAAA